MRYEIAGACFEATTERIINQEHWLQVYYSSKIYLAKILVLKGYAARVKAACLTPANPASYTQSTPPYQS